MASAGLGFRLGVKINLSYVDWQIWLISPTRSELTNLKLSAQFKLSSNGLGNAEQPVCERILKLMKRK